MLTKARQTSLVTIAFMLQHEITAAVRSPRLLFDLAGAILFVVVIYSGLVVSLMSDLRVPIALESGTTSRSGLQLIQRLRQAQALEFINAQYARKALDAGRVAATIAIPEGDQAIVIATGDSGYQGRRSMERIDRIVSRARRDVWNGLVTAQVPPCPLFLIETEIATTSKSYAAYELMSVVCVVFIKLASSMAMASQLVWDKEVRSKSLVNALIVPVERVHLMLVKCLTMILLATFSSSVFLIAFFSPFAVMFVCAQWSPLCAAYLKEVIPLAPFGFTCLFPVSTLLLGAICATSLLSLVAAVNAKWVPVCLVYHTLAIAMLIIAPIPDESSVLTSFAIPVYGLMLMLKHSAQGSLESSQLCVAIGSSLLVVLLSGALAVKLIDSEKFVLQSLEC